MRKVKIPHGIAREDIILSEITLQEGIGEFNIGIRTMYFYNINLSDHRTFTMLEDVAQHIITKTLTGVVDYNKYNLDLYKNEAFRSIRVGFKYKDLTPIEALIKRMEE